MSHFVDALAQARSEIRNQRWVILGLAVVALYAMHNWRAATTHFTAHFPPDLRNGSSIELSEKPVVPDTTVYTFAFYIWQQATTLFNWPFAATISVVLLVSVLAVVVLLNALGRRSRALVHG